MSFGIWDFFIVATVILVIVVVVVYFLNRWAGKRTAQHQEMVAQHKQTMSIYVIDKKKDKLTNANLPKAMTDQMPRMGKFMKMPLVKANVGTQIMTLVCDENVFNALPIKKNVSVEMAGIYIVGMKGMKTKLEMEAQRKARRKDGGDTAPKKWHENLLSKFKK